MTNNNIVASLYKEIKFDLNIREFDQESENDYHFRLVYSALARWILTLFKDRDFEYDQIETEFDKKVINSVSKSHVTLTAEKILNSFIKNDECLKEYFEEKERLNTINDIENVYETLGFVKSGNYMYKEMNVARNIKIGNFSTTTDLNTNNTIMMGLGLWNSTKSKDSDISSILLSKLDSLNAFKSMINQLPFSALTSELYNADIYELSKHKRVQYNPKNIENGKYYVARIDNGLDYKILTKKNDNVFCANLPLIYKKGTEEKFFKNEIRRMILGSYAFNNTPAICEISEIYNRTAYKVLFKGVILPEAEMALLKLFAWPLNNSRDIFNFIISKNMKSALIEILDRLNIKLEVK